jgi:mono/diheme cytochrome c family protein
MKRRRYAVLAGGLLVLAGAVSLDTTGSAHAREAAAAGADAQRALLDRYCVSCHNQKLKTAGLALDAADLSNVGASRDVWEKVLRKLHGGLMPPAGLPRPDRTAADSFTSWLEGELDRAAHAHPDPGRTEPLHRLNRAEYQNVIRDLLALEVDVTSLLPADDASYGFDNIAGVLKVSPTLLERYLAAARKISRAAVGTPVAVPSVESVRVPEDLPQDDRLEGLPFGTRGGTLVRHTFPVDGDYVVKVRLSRLGLSGGATEDVPRFPESHDLEVGLDGTRLALFTLAGESIQPGRRVDAYQQGRTNVDADWQVRVPVKAGPHELTVTFLRKSSALNETVRLPFLRPYAGAGGDTRYQPYLSTVTISGPFGTGTADETPSRKRIFTCRPEKAEDEPGCARQILAGLARRAYRRPVTDKDLGPLVEFFSQGRADGGFDAGIELALERLLVSPYFVFRVERDRAGAKPGDVSRIADQDLASRLSFFLWSSIPDDELLDVAAAGRLTEPPALERQVRRMLADSRSRALVENFAGQWLFLRNIPALSPDLDRFPDFDESLRDGFKRETELFVESIVREDRGVLDLLTADHTFVNERLARHYGMPNVKGSHFRRVTVTEPARQGLLGQGSILAVTAYPHRTSPVLRGKWILENLLGTPPPPPPPNVPDLKETNAAGQPLSMRERMAQHRANPSCATCHSMMDPPGFSLETFDAVGRLRSVDERFASIDAAGALPDGTKFDGPTGLRHALLSRPDRVVATFVEKLMTYALGRGLEPDDMPAVRRIVRESAGNGHRISAVVLGIVNSTPFQFRRSQS